METRPDQVCAALRDLSEALRPRARVELATLSATFRRLGGDVHSGDVHSDLHRGAVSGAGVRPWDLAYLIEQSRDSILGTDEAEFSQYLELGRCLEGIRMVFARAFGLQLAPMRAVPGELWHASVRKLCLSTLPRNGRPSTPLGLLYLDLEPRAGKTSHPALYTLRASAHDDAARYSLGAHDGALLLRHLPAAALVCDLPVPNGPGAEPSTGDALLRPRMLETLYHELGHALHALLARTECQHFAGVRAPHSNSSDDL